MTKFKLKALIGFLTKPCRSAGVYSFWDALMLRLASYIGESFMSKGKGRKPDPCTPRLLWGFNWIFGWSLGPIFVLGIIQHRGYWEIKKLFCQGCIQLSSKGGTIHFPLSFFRLLDGFSTATEVFLLLPLVAFPSSLGTSIISSCSLKNFWAVVLRS